MLQLLNTTSENKFNWYLLSYFTDEQVILTSIYASFEALDLYHIKILRRAEHFSLFHRSCWIQTKSCGYASLGLNLRRFLCS